MRHARGYVPGGVHHVDTRIVDGWALAIDDIDRRAFLAGVAALVRLRGWLCLAYCLMDTHYHLLVSCPEGDLSAGMARLNGGYASRFNRRHDRRGPLFAERFFNVLVEGDGHLLELVRYIVLNPLRARVCASPGDWRWSSYRATAGLEVAPPFLACDRVLELLSPDRARAIERYRAFVMDAPDLRA
jgi:REP element-mobilizing transposase RayT